MHLSNLPSLFTNCGAITAINLLTVQLETIHADQCPASSSSSTGDTSSNSNEVSLPTVLKTCPDFKDDAEQYACCPSQITQGTYYCCTSEQKEALEEKLAAEARRQFVANHIPEVVFCTVFFSILFVICSVFLCKRIQMCKRKFSYASSCTYDSTSRRSASRGYYNHHQTSRNGERRFFRNGSPLSQRFNRTMGYDHFVTQSASSTKPLNEQVHFYGEAPPSYNDVAQLNLQNTVMDDVQASRLKSQKEANTTNSPSLLVKTNTSESTDWNCLLENALNSELDRKAITPTAPAIED